MIDFLIEFYEFLKIRKKYKSAFIFRPEYYEMEFEEESKEEETDEEIN